MKGLRAECTVRREADELQLSVLNPFMSVVTKDILITGVISSTEKHSSENI